MTQKERKSQHGYVLINALMIVAALSALAVQSLEHANQGMTEVAIFNEAIQVDLMADAGITFASELIRKDLQGTLTDHLKEAWSLNNLVLEIGEGKVEVSVTDVQARLNINLLRNGQANRLSDILSDLQQANALAPEVPKAVANALTKQTKEETTKTEIANSQEKEEDLDEFNWFVPGDFTHALNIALVPGTTRSETNGYLPYLSALPRNARLNINTADRVILAAVTGLPPEVIEAILLKRAIAPIADLTDFQEMVEGYSGDAESVRVSNAILGVSSSWFDVRTVTRIEGEGAIHVTRLHRDANTGNVKRYYQQRIEP